MKENIVQFKPNISESNIEVIKRLKFGLHKYSMVDDKGIIREFWFVAVKDRHSNVTLELTSYTKILMYSVKTIDTTRTETIRNKGIFLCMFLNYVLIDNYEKFRIENIKDVTVEHGNIFLEAYANGEVGVNEKLLLTVEIAVKRLGMIYSNIKDIYKKDAKNIYNLKWKEKDKNGRWVYISNFNIRVNNPKDKDLIFRDMPEDIFNLLLELSKVYYPELTFAIALQAYAGLRPGEICNIRQAICPHDGGGIRYAKNGNKLIYFEINLKNKYPMRKDLKDVGNIKKRRIQKVYNKYLPNIKILYSEHMKIVERYNLEENYYPMFVNSNGQALTVKSYRDKIKKLTNLYLKKELLKSNDSRFRYYGQILTQRTLAPHFLRHFFTVRLVLDNITPDMVANWRGDNNLDTALRYCANKEELLNAIQYSNEKIIESILK